ncbi:MAG: hypothetical protein O2860_08945 [Chloroflexi bacterium]|nr:hypothetical protein [Chloroflexota bacterium]
MYAVGGLPSIMDAAEAGVRLLCQERVFSRHTGEGRCPDTAVVEMR